MPIVDLEAPSLFAPVDTPKGFAVTPGEDDINHGSEKPDFSTGAGAVFRQSNPLTSWLYAEDRASSPVQEPGFNPWDAIKGTKYEPNWNSFVEVRNTAAAENMKAKIDRETADRKMVDAMPLYQSFPVGLAAGILDPSVMLPGGAFVRGAKGGFSVAKTAASVAAGGGLQAGVEEAALHSSQETRTLGESAMNVGASVVLGGLLGAGGAKLLTSAEWAGAVKAIERELAGEAHIPVAGDLVPSAESVGAAAVKPATLGDNTIAGKLAETVANASMGLNPALRLNTSPSPVTREVGGQLFENSLYLKKNMEGIASEPAAETLMKEWNGGLAKAVVATDRAFADYSKAGGALSRTDFREAVGKAMRRGDEDADPFVAKVAKEWRDRVFDPLKNAAIETGQLPRDVSVDTALSYFTRMWNQNKLRAQEGAFKGVVRKWVEDNAPKWAETFDKQTERTLDPLHREIQDLEMVKLRRSEELKARQGAGEIRDTRGGGVQYHGTSMKDLSPSSDHYSTKNYYGQGFYTTDAVDIAHGYAKKGAKTEADRQLYRVEHTTDHNIYDAEAPINSDLLAKIRPRDNAVSELDDVIEQAIEEKPKNLRELYDNVREIGTGNGLSADTIQEIFTGINEHLHGLGYTGISHVGGLKTKNPAHRVVIYFEPETGVRLTPEEYRTYRGEADTSEMGEADIRNALRIVEGGAPRPKGVKTLTQFVADAGGLVDFSSELAYRGINNKARPGFIRKTKKRAQQPDGGWDMDDMARHAWESGYFPEHDARPSRDDFMNALQDDFFKTRAVVREADRDAFRLQELVDRLDADLARVGVRDAKGTRFSTSEELKGMVGRVYEAMNADADRQIKALKAKLAERQALASTEREARFLGDPQELSHGIADEVFNTLTGKTVEPGIRPEYLTIKARGPLKERTFNIPDHLVEDFLEHDVDLVGRRYTRVMGADVELARKFGSVDMVEQLQKVRDNYAELRSGLTDEKKLKALSKAEESDVTDLESLRDLLRGQTIYNHSVERKYDRIVRAANHVNYIRSMGEVVLASLTDAIRPAMVHGLGQFMATVPQLATNMKGIKLSVGEAQLAGNVAERVLGHRLATISDIIDPYASRGPVEAMLENLTNFASKWNGIRIWTDGMKSIASVMTQNRILTNAADITKIKPKEKAYMAYLGIDESMAYRIAKQFSEHGETVEGVKVANTEEWSDPVAVRTYRAAMNKDVDSIIVQKSVADVPLFANTPTGRALLQFKSFALASHQKMLLRGLQEDQSRFIGGTLAFTAMGMFMSYMKAISGNRPETQQKMMDNPGWWIAEGLDRSGMLSVPMEIANTMEKFSGGFNPIKAPFKAFDQGNGISQKNQNRSDIGSLLGPTIGGLGDVMTAGTIPKKLIEGEEITKGQKGAAERLIPFNSYVGMRQMLRYIANPPQ